MPKGRQVKLLTFASEGFYPQQMLLMNSAPAGGITAGAAWTDRQLKATEFYRAHREILDARRGSGYWLWKPYLIRLELDRASRGDFIVYYDVGRPSVPNKMTRPLGPLLEWCETRNGGMLPGVYVPEYGRNAKWTTRECFSLMGCDQPVFWEHPQVQATYSIWQKNDAAIALADEWLRWCTVPGILADDPAPTRQANFPDFIDHRHDQSVMTILAIKDGIKCYGDPDTSLPGSKNINNLVDRIRGKEFSIRCRNIAHFAMRQYNQRILRK